jgi:hypothetical protein
LEIESTSVKTEVRVWKCQSPWIRRSAFRWRCRRWRALTLSLRVICVRIKRHTWIDERCKKLDLGGRNQQLEQEEGFRSPDKKYQKLMQFDVSYSEGWT